MRSGFILQTNSEESEIPEPTGTFFKGESVPVQEEFSDLVLFYDETI